MSYECPTCDDEFPTEQGMKMHHTRVHGESLTLKTYTCPQCGDEFERQESLTVNDKPCCSNQCADLRKQRLTGEEAANWRGGHDDHYGYWFEQRKGRVRERDGACKICEGEDDLEVHHIRPIRLFEDLELANRMDNMVLLCRTCHMAAEHNRVKKIAERNQNNGRQELIPRV